MTQTGRTPAAIAPSRPVLGLRRRPGRLALALFRLPLRSARAGHLPGHVFVSFVHHGRWSGHPYESVALVLAEDADTGEVVICAAWGEQTDWLRNIRDTPASLVRLGRRTFAPEQRFLTDDEAVAVVRRFRDHHPVRARLVGSALGWHLHDEAEVRRLVATHQFVAFRPSRAAAGATSAPGAAARGSAPAASAARARRTPSPPGCRRPG